MQVRLNDRSKSLVKQLMRLYRKCHPGYDLSTAQQVNLLVANAAVDAMAVAIKEQADKDESE